MAAADIHRIIGGAVGVQGAAIDFHIVVHLAFHQIAVAVAVHQRANLPHGNVLQHDVSRTALDAQIGIQRAGVAVTVDHEPAGACHACELYAGGFIERGGIAGQIDGHIVRQILVVQRLHRIA